MTTDGETVSDSAADHGDEAYCSACNQSFTPDTDRCPHDGTKLIRFKAQKDELIGRVLDGRFEVRQPLGKGGMGTVYRALQVSVDREIAIKVVHPKLANDRQAAKRFLREARLASRLNQPNIVNVIDFGQTEDGVLFLAMELLRGRTLAAELGGHRRFPVRRTANIALQLCDALEAAHAQGIVHRDLKPGNIVILDDPPGRDLLKVLDFGLAKSLIADTTSQVTNTNAILGTPLYMSPEQVEGKASDQRADLYSLGCILYELLGGAPPFVDSSVNLLLARHLSDPPAPLPPHVPAGIRTVVERLLAKRPEDRIQTAGEVRAAIQAATEGGVALGIEPADTLPDVGLDPALATTATSMPAARMMSPSPGGVAAPAAATMTATAPAPRSRSALWLVLIVVGGIGVAGGYVAFRQLRDGAATGADAGAGSAIVADDLDAVATPTSSAPVDAAPAPADAAPAPADAAPAPIDAPAPAPADAAKRRDRDRDHDHDRDRHRARPDARPAAPRDASAPRKPDAEPDIDFYRPK